MKINLYIRTQEGERVAVGAGDPKDLLRSIAEFGVEGEAADVVGQWFYDADGLAGFEAIVDGEA